MYIKSGMRPSEVIDCMYANLEFQIKDLEEENARLRKENEQLRNEAVSSAQLMSARTLQLALSGAFDNAKPETLKGMGYDVPKAEGG